jgi:hypothetical protein
MFCVKLYSFEYGAELFKYDTEAEALEGMRRLKKDCRKETKKDGIEREICYLGELTEDEIDALEGYE